VIALIRRHGEQLLCAMEEAAAGQQWKTLIQLDAQLAELLRRLKPQPMLKKQLPMVEWQNRHRQLITLLEARQNWLGERLRGDSDLREGKRAYREVQLYGGEK